MRFIIRENRLPAANHYGIVEVDINQWGVSIFQFDKTDGKTNAEYIALTNEEAKSLLEALKEGLA